MLLPAPTGKAPYSETPFRRPHYASTGAEYVTLCYNITWSTAAKLSPLSGDVSLSERSRTKLPLSSMTSTLALM